MTVIFHIDVNSAYLSWSAAEKLRRGETLDLRTVPAIIGGNEKSRHGVVLAKSSPAKAYGIRTGEPVAAALRKCPFLVMEPPDHALYRKRSRELMDFFPPIRPTWNSFPWTSVLWISAPSPTVSPLRWRRPSRSRTESGNRWLYGKHRHLHQPASGKDGQRF